MHKTRMIVIAIVLLLMAACGGNGNPGERSIRVVATTTIVGDLVRNVVGDGVEVEVEVLMPLGVDAHAYLPSAQHVALISEADLVVAIGLGLEEGLVDVLASAASDGANILEIAPALAPLPFSASHSHEDDEIEEEEDHDEEDEPGADGLDPHVWLDPVRMADAARLVAQRLAAIDDSGRWAENAETYASLLLALDGRIDGLLASVEPRDRKLVTNHDALGYFADRYGFEIVGTVIPSGSTLADPSSAQLAALVGVMEHEGVAAIFAETTDSTALADAVAAELGRPVEVALLFTESLGEPGSGAETLIDLLEENARRIASALG